MNDILISDIKYAVGEQRLSYRDAVSFRRTVEEQGLPEDSTAFGWGNYYKTEKSIADLGIASAKETLQSGRSNEPIDVVLFCSTNFGSFAVGECESIYQRILSELELSRAFIIGITLNNCTNLLSAMNIGSALLARDNCASLLVISSDKVVDEEFRFTDACLFSDAAVSFLMSKSRRPGFAITADGFASDHRLISEKSVFGDVQLYRNVHEDMCARSGADPSRIRKLFTNNVFIPILKVKESSVGLAAGQLYLDNVPRHGHCFSADPLINLSDYCLSNAVNHDDKFMLTSNASGLRAVMIIAYRQAGG